MFGDMFKDWAKNIAGTIVEKMIDAWRSLLLLICEAIYKLINYVYDLFISVGTADIIKEETIQTIFNRISLILGIFMLFKLVISFVQMLINPDYVIDKEKGVGNLVKKSILVIALLGVMPYIFEEAMSLQNKIVGIEDGYENIIAKVIIPTSDPKRFNNVGALLSAHLFTTFYRYDSHIESGCDILDLNDKGETYLYNSIYSRKGDIKLAYNCINTKNSDGDYYISFSSDGMLAVIVGIVVLALLISYTISVGVRVVQLVFLRIISPLAIMSYLSPKKETMFEKWTKMCITTYIDLFIRMAIIYFVLYLITLLMDGIELKETVLINDMWIIEIVFIIALLIFAKKAPELLKELFPKSGSASLGFGLKSPKSLFNDMLGGGLLSKGYDRVTGFAKSVPKRGVGMLAGAAVGAGLGFSRTRGKDNDGNKVRGRRIGAAVGGAFRGGFYGAHSGKLGANLKNAANKQIQFTKKKNQWNADEVTFGDRMKERFAIATGRQDEAERISNDIEKLDIRSKDITAKQNFVKGAKDITDNLREKSLSWLKTEDFTNATGGKARAASLQQKIKNFENISEHMKGGDIKNASAIVNSEKARIDKEKKSVDAILNNDTIDDKTLTPQQRKFYSDYKQSLDKDDDRIKGVERQIKLVEKAKEIEECKAKYSNDPNSILSEYIKLKESDPSKISDDDRELIKVWEDDTSFKDVKEYNDLKQEYEELSQKGKYEKFNASSAEQHRIAVEKEASIQGVDLSLSGSGGSGGVVSMFEDFKTAAIHDQNSNFVSYLGENSPENTNPDNIRQSINKIYKYEELEKLSDNAKDKLPEISKEKSKIEIEKDALERSEEYRKAQAVQKSVGKD